MRVGRHFEVLKNDTSSAISVLRVSYYLPCMLSIDTLFMCDKTKCVLYQLYPANCILSETS